MSPALNQQCLCRRPNTPISIEDLRRSHAHAVRPNRRASAQREIVADRKPVQMNDGVGVHKGEPVRIEDHANTVRAVGNAGKPLHRRCRFGVDDVDQRAQPGNRGRLSFGVLPPPVNRVEIAAGAGERTLKRFGVPSNSRGYRSDATSAVSVTVTSQAVSRATARADPSGRSARISATIMDTREPGRSTHAVARTGLTGIAPRMSRLSRAIRRPVPADCSSISFFRSANGGEPCWSSGT